MQYWLILATLLAISPLAQATSFANALQTYWYHPRAADFRVASHDLPTAISGVCDAQGETAEQALDAARQQWLTTMTTWERLSSVAVGPLLEQRLQRRLDFTPTRPRMILKAIAAAPGSLTDLERIGTPAKGIPALEWLLWTQPITPASTECRYAALLAEELAHEAALLETAWLRAGLPDETAALAELLNQWVGGLERLRWTNLEMPVRVAGTAGPEVLPDYPRASAPAASWAAQWQALAALAAGETSLASLLRQRGQMTHAANLTHSVQECTAAMHGLTAQDSAGVLRTSGALAKLKRLVEDEIAPALGVSIGFSDADGD